jgi:hypothetical protein
VAARGSVSVSVPWMNSPRTRVQPERPAPLPQALMSRAVGGSMSSTSRRCSSTPSHLPDHAPEKADTSAPTPASGGMMSMPPGSETAEVGSLAQQLGRRLRGGSERLQRSEAGRHQELELSLQAGAGKDIEVRGVAPRHEETASVGAVDRGTGRINWFRAIVLQIEHHPPQTEAYAPDGQDLMGSYNLTVASKQHTPVVRRAFPAAPSRHSGPTSHPRAGR